MKWVDAWLCRWESGITSYSHLSGISDPCGINNIKSDIILDSFMVLCSVSIYGTDGVFNLFFYIVSFHRTIKNSFRATFLGWLRGMKELYACASQIVCPDRNTIEICRMMKTSPVSCTLQKSPYSLCHYA